MVEVQKYSGANADGGVVLQDGTPVSLEIVQQIYREVHGAEESLNQILYDNHLITRDHIKQLILQLSQAASTQPTKSENMCVSIVRTDENRSTYNCMDTFESADTSSASPIEAVVIEFKFLIQNPKTSKLQSYEIEISLISRAAKRFKAAKSHGVDAGLMRLSSNMSGNIKVSYTDYLVGKYFFGVIQNWYEAVDKSTKSKWSAIISRHNDWTFLAFRSLATLIFCGIIYLFRESIFPEALTNKSLFVGGFVLFIAFNFIIALALRFANGFTSFVSRLHPVSAIVFSDAEQKVVDNYNQTNARIVTRSVLYLLGKLTLTVIVTLIATGIVKSLA